MEEKERTVDNNIFSNPYKFFYNDKVLSKLEENEDITVDDYKHEDYNEEVHRQYLDSLFEYARDHKHEYIYEAMKHDPAFMVDPINEYYLPLIKHSFGKETFNAFSEDQVKEILSILDPVTWAERNLLQRSGYGGKWTPRASKKGIPYQSMLIRCKSRSIAARAGRRLGKTAALVVRLLHRAFTFSQKEGRPVYNIVIFTPNQSQINVIFKMMDIFIDNNPLLLKYLVSPKGGHPSIPTRKNPQTVLELNNGVTITGFVSGSTAVRGSAANLLVLDEGSFLTADDTDSVVALLSEDEDVEFWVSSTPKGLKDYFYDMVKDPMSVDFYFPTDKFHPNWSYAMEQSFRSKLTDAGYRFEVLAEFAADGEGVFQHPFIDEAIERYDYRDCKYDPTWMYGIGVDWNDEKNGSQIVVTGYNPKYEEERSKPYRIVDAESISIAGWTQTNAVKAVRNLNRKWKASFIYCDYGFGATQIELLHAIGGDAPPSTIDHNLTKAKSINFSSKFEIRDPWTNKRVQKPAKPYLVNNSVRIFEDKNIAISSKDESLVRQFEGYIIDSVTPSGTPRYSTTAKDGDHKLDAFMLSVLGFNLEASTLSINRISTVDELSMSHILEHSDIGISDKHPSQVLLEKDKERDRKEVEESGGKSAPLSSYTPGLHSSPIRRQDNSPIVKRGLSQRNNNTNTSFRRRF